MALALKFGWLGRFATDSRSEALRMPIVASRDLPPLDPLTGKTLPRSPEPMPDEALQFARSAAERAASEPSEAPALSIVEGIDLRVMLERFHVACRRREALHQAAQARDRIVERLSAGKCVADPHAPLQLAAVQQLPPSPAMPERADEPDIEAAMAQALTSALGTLRQISELSRPA